MLSASVLKNKEDWSAKVIARLFALIQVDNKRQDLEIQDSNKVDVDKLSRFVRINELRWVTEYNPMVTKEFSKT